PSPKRLGATRGRALRPLQHFSRSARWTGPVMRLPNAATAAYCSACRSCRTAEWHLRALRCSLVALQSRWHTPGLLVCLSRTASVRVGVLVTVGIRFDAQWPLCCHRFDDRPQAARQRRLLGAQPGGSTDLADPARASLCSHD